jgi:hypothetical protein
MERRLAALGPLIVRHEQGSRGNAGVRGCDDGRRRIAVGLGGEKHPHAPGHLFDGRRRGVIERGHQLVHRVFGGRHGPDEFEGRERTHGGSG